MARTENTEKSLVNKFVNAIAYLDDIKTIHTDHNLTNVRARLLGSGGAASNDVVRALEVLGIANAIAARYPSTSQHRDHASGAAGRASMLYAGFDRWFSDHNATAGAGSSAPASGEGDDGYRAFLLTHLDWVHKGSTVHDDAPADTSTCLCPVTAYLQLILRYTPVEDWAAAATDPDASPLAFAWEWARNSPGIGRQMADVAVLVTMGRHVYRSMAYAPAKAEEERMLAAISIRGTFLNEGVWAALRVVAKDSLTAAVTWLRTSPSDSDNYKRKRELSEAEELLATVQSAAERLGEAGKQYAQLLVEDQMAEKREAVVDSIRVAAGFILSKAEPPVPEKVLLVIAGLAEAGQ
jgi:hypothetical protein